jgi:hypothetical protein
MASKKFVVKHGLRSDGNVLINKSIDNNTDKLQVAGSVSVSDQVKSTLATGTAPMIIASTTAVSNLNADLLDGEHGAYYLDGANFTGTLPNNYVTLGTMTTGNYVATIAGTTNEVEVSGSGSETAAVTIGLPDDVTIGNELTVTTGLFTPLIDTTDSSAITIVPAATFNSNVTVENTLTVGNDVAITGNTVSTGDVTAVRFFGDGSGLTGLVATYTALTDTDTTGRTTGSLNRFNGSAYVPTTLTEDASGNVTVGGQLNVSTIDTTDSSAITVVPITNFDSDITVGNNLTVNGYITGPATLVIDPAAVGNATGEVIIAGNLTVQGNTTQVDSNVVNIGDAIITLNSDETGAPSQNAGLEIERGTSDNVLLRWNESNDKWEITTDGTNYNAISTVDATVTSLTGTANEVEVDTSTGDVTVGLPNDVTIGNELTVTTGLFTPLIDTTDSSAVTVVPATAFRSDITVENDIVANNKITVSGNVVANANVVVSNEVQFTGHSNASSTLTTTATTQVALHNLSVTAYAGAEVIITATQGNLRHITKLLITHDASDAYATEYGEILTGASLATYNVDLSGGNIRLLTTPASATSTKFNVSVVQLYN